MAAAEGLVEAVARELSRSGIDPAAWALGWARLVPSLVLVPAFGLRAVPVIARILFALILAACVAPALVPLTLTEQPWLIVMLVQLGSGLPVAVSAAVTLWAAGMAGNLLDELRGASHMQSTFVGIEGPASPFGILFSLAAAIAFLKLGGPARLAEALSAAEPVTEQSLRGVAIALAQGIQIAVLISAPFIAVVLFLELFQALVSRAARPAHLAPSLAPLRSIALVAIAALLLDRLLEGLVAWMDASLPPG
jgi:type III secretory pathway component EscT